MRGAPCKAQAVHAYAAQPLTSAINFLYRPPLRSGDQRDQGRSQVHHLGRHRQRKHHVQARWKMPGVELAGHVCAQAAVAWGCRACRSGLPACMVLQSLRAHRVELASWAHTDHQCGSLMLPSRRQNKSVDKPEESTEIDINEPVALTFALRYLNSFAKVG